jgi:hypothetical protein
MANSDNNIFAGGQIDLEFEAMTTNQQHHLFLGSFETESRRNGVIESYGLSFQSFGSIWSEIQPLVVSV